MTVTDIITGEPRPMTPDELDLLRQRRMDRRWRVASVGFCVALLVVGTAVFAQFMGWWL